MAPAGAAAGITAATMLRSGGDPTLTGSVGLVCGRGAAKGGVAQGPARPSQASHSSAYQRQRVSPVSSMNNHITSVKRMKLGLLDPRCRCGRGGAGELRGQTSQCPPSKIFLGDD